MTMLAQRYGMVRPRAKRCLDIRVGKESIERAACIMDTLLKALDVSAIELIQDGRGKGGTQSTVRPWTFIWKRKQGVRNTSLQQQSRKNWMKIRITVTGYPRTSSFPLEIYP